MLTKSEAKRLVHKITVTSLRRHKASKLFPDIKKESEHKKLDEAMEELAAFLEKRGKLDEQSSEADAGGKGGPEEAEVPAVRKS